LRQFGAKLETVDPPFLRKLFKSPEASAQLEKLIKEKPRIMGTLLELIVSGTPYSPQDFDGCRVLPLVDGTLGTLRINSGAAKYLGVNQEEADIFKFAPNIFVINTITAREFMKQILLEKQFNVRRLSLQYIGGILERGEWNEGSTLRTEWWLKSFWEFFNANYISKPSLQVPATKEFGIDHFPLFLTTCDETTHYMKPMDIDQKPVIVEPNTQEQKELCLNIRGLHLLNPEMLPSDMVSLEDSLYKDKSLERFIRALERLAQDTVTPLETFVSANLNPERLRVCCALPRFIEIY